jgi:fumarylacetoacetate (FAA) hydrolase
MRFVYYDDLDTRQTGLLGVDVFGAIYNLAELITELPGLVDVAELPVPATIWDYHAWSPQHKARLHVLVERLSKLDPEQRAPLIKPHTRRLLPAGPPESLRCFSTFAEHARATRQRRGLGLPVEWFEYPAFFFGNRNAMYAAGDSVPQPASFWLDYEIQVACIIGKSGTNIRADEAETYVAGYTIMNDWCARDLEMYEMRVGIGPAKGRDFAVSLGPALVTPDELEPYAIGEGAQRRYDLNMTVSVNEHALNLVPGNLRAMHFSFAQMIERASADAMLYPGDVLASGAVGGGSLLSMGAEETLGRWLQPGDRVDLEVEVLGVLRNTVGDPIF